MVGLGAPHPPPPRVTDKMLDGAGKVEPAPIQTDNNVQEEGTNTPTSPCVAALEANNPPVPAPRRMSGSSAEPVPAPRTGTIHTVNSFSATGEQSQCIIVVV